MIFIAIIISNSIETGVKFSVAVMFFRLAKLISLAKSVNDVILSAVRVAIVTFR